MTDIAIRPLGEDEWATFRTARLAALTESPDAFTATAADEEQMAESEWRDRMRRSVRLLAGEDDHPTGVASVAMDKGESGTQADLFGLWVTPAARGTGVATALVRAARNAARSAGMTHLTYWVGTDNGRAVAFASGFGFRPTDDRREAHLSGEPSEEIQMVLPLGGDRGAPTVD